MKQIQLRSLLYGILTILGVAVFGYLSEVCDRNDDICTSRLNAVIAFSVLACAFSLILFAGTLVQLKLVIWAEMFLAPLVFAFWTVCVSIMTSPRTEERFVRDIIIHLTWWAEIISFSAMFLIFTAEEQPLKRTKKTTKHDIEQGNVDTVNDDHPQEHSTVDSSKSPTTNA